MNIHHLSETSNAGIFPMSFAQVQKKFAEYVKGGRRRHSKNIGVDMCKYFYSSPPSSPTLPPIERVPAIVEENQFRSPPPPVDYYTVYKALETMEGKYLELLSSPSRAKGQYLFQTTRVLLEHVTLLEHELYSSRVNAIATIKVNLNRREVLSKGGSTYVMKINDF